MDTSNNSLDVFASAHPFRVAHEHLVVPAGTTVAEIVDTALCRHVEPGLGARAHVEIEGWPVPVELWAHVRPKRPVCVSVVPAGGGDDKNVLRSVLILGVTIAGGGITSGAFLSGMTGATAGATAASVALGAATTLVGRALVNQIAPPPQPDLDNLANTGNNRSDALIESTRNRLKPYGVVPRVYGRYRVVPMFAAKPFTEIQGEDQYFRALYVWGHGRLDVSDIKIGDTPVTEFDDVDIETVGDRTADGDPSLFSQSVDEVDLNIALNQSDGFQTRTTADVADEISVDIVFPQGLFKLNDDGSKSERVVDVEVEYAEAGTGNWRDGNKSVAAQELTFPDLPPRHSPKTFTYRRAQQHRVMIDKYTGDASFVSGPTVSRTYAVSAESAPPPPNPEWGYGVAVVGVSTTDGIDFISDLDGEGFTGFAVTQQSTSLTVDVGSGTIDETRIVVTEKQSGAIRRSLRIATGDGTKTYDVRLKRVTADSTDDSVYDEVRWSKLRAIQHEQPVTMDGVALTAVRIRATDQLNGILDQLNGVCQAIMPDYDVDNNKWVQDAAANSPAAAFRNVLEGDANERALATSRIDLDALENWVEFTANATPQIKFNHVFDTEGSVSEALDLIASTGRASKGLTDGKWTVVVDEKKSTVVQHLTPRNTRNFSSEKIFGEVTHAVRARFFNADRGWQQDEIVVFNDGYNADGSGGKTKATRFEALELRGVTAEDQAYRAARYHLAVDKLRPETYTFELDVEHLVATRGDLVRASHDVPQWGTGYGRVTSVSTDSTGAVDQFTLDTEVVLTGDRDYVVRFRLSDGSTKLVDIVDPGIDVETNEFTPETAIANNKPEVGDLAMVGIVGKESVELVVKSVQPGPDLTARVTALDYAPAVFDAHTESIPDFDPRITNVSQFVGTKPPEPEVESIQSDEGVLARNPDGSVSARLVVTYAVPSDSAVRATDVQMRWRKAGSASAYATIMVDAQSGQIVTADVDQGDSYRIEIRSVSATGVASGWVTVASAHQIVGATSKPPDVTGFELEIVGQSVYLFWDEVTVFDLSHYEIRFSPLLTGVTWGTATTLRNHVSKSATEVAVPGKVGTYLIKAVDRGGRKSAGAAAIASNATEVEGLNFIELDKEDPDYAGDRVDIVEVGGNLRLAAIDVIADWDALSDVDRMDYALQGPVSAGEYRHDATLDLGQKFTSRLTPAIEADAINLKNTLDTWAALADIDPISGAVEDDWSVGIDVRTSDDPNSTTAVDETSNGNDGTLVNGPAWVLAGPVDDIQGALSFDGGNDYVDHGDVLDQTGSFTIETWLFPDDVDTAEQRLVAKDDGVDGWALSLGDPGSGALRFFHRDLNTVSTDTAAGLINTNQWFHVAVVFDAAADTVTIYVDGAQEAQTTGQTNTISSNANALRFGTDDSGSGQSFLDGQLGDVRIWNTARTQTEIADNKDKRLVGDEAGLVGYWTLQGPWTDPQELRLGDYTARAFEFRTRLSAARSWLTPSLSRLEVEVDMPDRVEGEDDVVVSGGTLAVSYSPAFRAKPALGYTAEDLNGGEYLLVKNKTRSGFDVEIRDSEQSGDPLVSGDRTFTWIAKGYGREVV